MIISGSMQSAKPAAEAPKLDAVPDEGGGFYVGRAMTKSKQAVSPETSKRVATVYRCSNGISNDIASMPLQQFQRANRNTQKIDPDAVTRNMAYLLELAPNRYMTPFVFKKTVVTWLQFWGNALIWLPPPPSPRELFILPTNRTAPKQDANGNLWYEVRFPSGETKYIPAVEILHIMINSTNGIWGKSVLEYARETVGLRMGMSETQSSIQGGGLNPSAYIQMGTVLDKAGREKIRESYSEAISGASGAGQLAVFDSKVVKFEPITMKLTEAQFLESIEATDMEIANFFQYPAYKLNLGKQSYQSNEQQDLDYLKSTLDPHLVQWEQAARLRWLPEAEQGNSYFKFIRESVLRTNAKSRAELHEIEIRSGMLTPNEGREHEDRNSYEGGDTFWMTSNNASVNAPREPVATETETP